MDLFDVYKAVRWPQVQADAYYRPTRGRYVKNKVRRKRLQRGRRHRHDRH